MSLCCFRKNVFLWQGLYSSVTTEVLITTNECVINANHWLDSKSDFIVISPAVADLRGGSPPTAKNVPKFMQFFWKIWQNRMLAPPGGSATPPTGNPGSAPVLSFDFKFSVAQTECLNNPATIYSEIQKILLPQLLRQIPCSPGEWYNWKWILYVMKPWFSL